MDVIFVFNTSRSTYNTNGFLVNSFTYSMLKNNAYYEYNTIFTPMAAHQGLC